MATFSFKPIDSTTLVSWNDPSVWAGGVVPNDPAADVDFPTVTYVATGQVYNSTVTIGAGESFNTHSIALRDSLNIGGSLTVGTNLTQYQYGSINMSGGTLSAGAITNDSFYIQGSGQITTGAFTNDTSIVGSGLTISATSFNSPGTITAASGNITINVTAGGFAQLSGGTLSGGTYVVGTTSNNTVVTTPNTLAFNTGSLITTDATSITLQGGMITSHDPVSGQDVPITTSLTTIAPSGSLAISFGAYNFGPLTVSGSLSLSSSSYAASQLASSQLTITNGGTLQGSGIVNAPITNGGTILAQQSALVLNGAVSGSGHLELSNNAASKLELNGATSQNVLFDGSAATLQIDQPASFTGTITPTNQGDRIVLAGISAQGTTATYSGTTSGGMLTLQQASGGTTSLKFIGNFTQSSFTVAAGPQLLSSDPPSLLVTVGQAATQGRVCFVAGTRILTPEGERAVEGLSIGDSVTTWAGATKIVTWIGSGTTVVSARDPRSRPVIVRAGALDRGVPCRDLHVTEGHSLLVDGVLIPVASLINGRSILWDEIARTVTYYHVELADHDILVADGAPAESYRDDGNRICFSRDAGMRDVGFKPPFATILTEGPIVDAAWRRLVQRAGGPIDGLTDDPDLHLLVDGHRVDPIECARDRYRFALTGMARTIVISSRAVVPALAGTARDQRRLGVALQRITITDGGGTIEIDHASDLLASGFHEAEHDGRLRWTDGRAELPMAASFGFGGCEMVLDIACVARYPASENDRALALRRAA